MLLLQFTWGVITTLALFCEALPSENPLNRREANDTLGLYAFGSHITQLPIFYADGAAQIGNITSSNATVKAPIYVTLSTTETGTLIAHVNITQSPDVKFDSSGNSSTTNFLCLTQSNATANRVAFSQSRAETGNVTNNWTLYGGYALINNGSANLFARSAGIDGLYDLFWSTSSLPNDYTPLTVRAFSQ